MHHHLSDLKHPQWGSIVGYEADVRLAVLEDELEMWEEKCTGNERNSPDLEQVIDILKSRIEEVRKDAVLFKDPPDGDLRAILDIPKKKKEQNEF